MNNRIFAAPKLTTLVRVWRSTGEPGMPLISAWVQAKTTKLRTDAGLSSDETGGLCLRA